MEYALKRGEGLIAITGQPGIGKTVFTNDLVASLPSNQWLAFKLTNTQWGEGDLLRTVTASFGLQVETEQPAAKVLKLKQFLAENQRQDLRSLLIIDEAQSLSIKALNELRALTNLQDNGHSLLQIFLAGEEQLWDLFRQPGMGDLHQRVIAACHLDPLSVDETEAYIKYRLHKVGWNQDPRINSDIFPVIQEFTGGVPRLINVVCDRLLLSGYVNERRDLGGRDAQLVIDELQREGSIEEDCNVSSALLAEPVGTLATTSVEAVSHNNLELPNRDKKTEGKAEFMQASQGDATITPISHTPSEKEKPMNRTETLVKVLKTLQTGSPDVEAAALITEDGLMIASALPQDLDETRVGGMSATLLSLGTRAAKELRRGEVQEVIVRGEEGYAVMIDIGRGVLLLVVANENAKLGMIFFDMREAIGAIKRIL